MAVTTLSVVTSDVAAEAVKEFNYLSFADRQAIGAHPAIAYAGDVGGSRSLTKSIAVHPVNGTDWSAATENTDYSTPTSFASSAITVTTAIQRQNYELTRETRLIGAEGDWFNDPKKLAQMAVTGRDLVLTKLLCTAAATSSLSSSDSGNDLTWEVIYDAIEQLGHAGANGPFLAVFSPKQARDLQVDMLAKGSLAVSPLLPMSYFSTLGAKGNINGIDIFVSTRVATSGGDDVGFIAAANGLVFADGSFPESLGQGFINLGKVGISVNEKVGVNSTEISLMAPLGASLGPAGGVCKIVSVSGTY